MISFYQKTMSIIYNPTIHITDEEIRLFRKILFSEQFKQITVIVNVRKHVLHFKIVFSTKNNDNRHQCPTGRADRSSFYDFGILEIKAPSNSAHGMGYGKTNYFNRFIRNNLPLTMDSSDLEQTHEFTRIGIIPTVNPFNEQLHRLSQPIGCSNDRGFLTDESDEQLLRESRPTLKSLADRLKEKEGRIRSSVMGMRTNHSIRTVAQSSSSSEETQTEVPLNIWRNLPNIHYNTQPITQAIGRIRRAETVHPPTQIDFIPPSQLSSLRETAQSMTNESREMLQRVGGLTQSPRPPTIINPYFSRTLNEIASSITDESREMNNIANIVLSSLTVSPPVVRSRTMQENDRLWENIANEILADNDFGQPLTSTMLNSFHHASQQTNSFNYISNIFKKTINFTDYYTPCETEFDGTNPSCTICLEPFEEKTLCVTANHCNHIFHKTCLESWLSQHETCPNCRTELKKKTMPLQQTNDGDNDDAIPDLVAVDNFEDFL